jgi:glycosyltransferase involved in cell wall biosynthesis
MRVVHVASGRLFGGIEQMLVTLARARALTPEVETTFALAASGRLAQELRAAGADTHVLGEVRLSRPDSVIRARLRLAKILEGARADVVVCHAPWSYAIFAPIARRANRPVVWWQHDQASGRPLVERWAARTRAALVVCNSAWTARTASAVQPDVPLAVIHPPVAVPPPEPGIRTTLRRDLGAAPADVVLLSASRLEPWKGHRNLVRALTRLSSKMPWTLWIAGAAQRPHEHRYLTELRAEVSALGLEARVQFLGERRDVPRLMQAVDVFCQPNDGPEPFGVVFAEALLSGVPVVTTAAGGAPEIVSDACGRLVPAGDLEALSRALGELIDNEGLRAGLGAAGPAHAAARCAPAVILPRLAAALAALDRGQPR